MTYNGHKNWNFWNVSLWLGNDESLYRLCQAALNGRTKDKAARYLAEILPAKTPDGAPYSVGAIRAALVGM